MKNMIFVFQIRNHQSDFAKSLQFINKINALDCNLVQTDIPSIFATCCILELSNIKLKRKFNYIHELEGKLGKSTVVSLPFSQYKESINKIGKSNVYYHFRVFIQRDEEVTNLQSYFLIKQAYPNCSLVLDVEEVADSFRISSYLMFETKKNNNDIFIKNRGTREEVAKYGIVHKLPGTSRRSGLQLSRLRNFTPLIEITKESYTLLSQNVGHSIAKVYESQDIVRLPERIEGDYRDKDKLEVLVDMCLNYLYDSNDSERLKIFRGEEFYKEVNGFSLLSFLFFCSFQYFSRDEDNSIFTMDELRIAMSDALDYGDGILQIIENTAFHSQYKRGYLSFRIFNYKKDNFKTYLHREYSNYIDNQIERNMDTPIPQFFLETRVADYNCIDNNTNTNSVLVEKFLSNLQLRVNDGEDDLKGFSEKFQGITVKDFFQSNPDNPIVDSTWDCYYKNPENIIHHYGLRLFDIIVQNSNGYFQVISNKTFSLDSSQYYSSTDHSFQTKQLYITGTQYRTLYPFHHRSFSKQYAGIDTDVNMTKVLNQILDEDWQQSEHEVFHSLFTFTEDTQLVSNQTTKQEYIRLLSSEIQASVDSVEIKQQKYIHQFMIGKIKDNRWVELICKATFHFVCQYQSKYPDQSELYLVFNDCQPEFITEFVRFAAVLYSNNRTGRLGIMQNTQIYLLGQDHCDEFLLSGETCSLVRKRAYDRAAFRGIYPKWLNSLDYVLARRQRDQNNDLQIQQPEDTTIFNQLPFDILVQQNNMTVFENTVKWVLENPIDHEEMGCKIFDTHVRLGSKIHVRHFYEAQLLFQNNYFTNRFAYLIAKAIIDQISKCDSKGWFGKRPIYLVGYENYSEMLIYQTWNMLANNQQDRFEHYKFESYLICENSPQQLEFRSPAQGKDMDKIQQEDGHYIFIVPINSTLTTHNKMRAGLEKRLGYKLEQDRILANFALIFIRDDCPSESNMTPLEEEYRMSIDTGNRTISTSLISPDVQYFVSGNAMWENPLACTMCFSNGDNQDEIPLIETNRTSIITSLQMGLREGNHVVPKSVKPQHENLRRLEKLSEYLHYNHLSRNGNHFLYYFETNKFYSDHIEDVRAWLEGNEKNKNKSPSPREIVLRDKLNKSGDTIQTYDFIVVPMHSSNAGFVEEVNRIVFNSSAQIIRFEVNKEYRDNIKTKYSNLTALYENLCKASQHIQAIWEINFHFVDDIIVSGQTIIRANSLIRSLFPTNNSDPRITINIFKNIFVLLNRNSNATIRSYMDRVENYHNYIHLNISSIRNHDDFCFMCTLMEDANNLAAQASTNEMSQRWKATANKFEVRPAEHAKSQADEILQQRYRNRLLSTHLASDEMDHIGDARNDAQVVFGIIVKRLLYTKMSKVADVIHITTNNLNWLFSVIKVLSRPFLVYRRSVREAIFQLLLILIEVFLSEKTNVDKIINHSKYAKDVRLELKSVCTFLATYSTKKDKHTYNLLLVFMKQLTELNSNYIIRKSNMERIFASYKGIQAVASADSKEDFNDFEMKYAILIKQLTSLSSDEIKSTWLECLLLFGNEYPRDKEGLANEPIRNVEFLKVFGIESNFGQRLYVENTKVLLEGVKDLAKPYMNSNDSKNNELIEKEIRELLESNDEYYLDNFRKVMYFNGMLTKENKLNSGATQKVSAMVNLYVHIHKYDNKENPNTLRGLKELQEFYSEIAQGVCGATNALKVQFILGTENKLNEQSNRIKDFTFTNTSCVICESKEADNPIHSVSPFIPSMLTIEELEIGLEMNTYKIYDRPKKKFKFAIIKYISDNEAELDNEFQQDMCPIYLVIQFEQSSSHVEIIKSLRNIMIFRSNIIKQMQRDFNNNLFDELQKTADRTHLLSHFKNVSHTDKSVLKRAIEVIAKQKHQFDEFYGKESNRTYGDEEKFDSYFNTLIAITFRLMSDIHVSKTYHRIVTDKLQDKYVGSGADDIPVIQNLQKNFLFKSRNILSMIGDFDDANPAEINTNNLKNLQMYYMEDERNESILMVLTIILNAFRYGVKEYGIEIYNEEANDLKPCIEYFCIKNVSRDSFSKNFKHEMVECLTMPVGKRSTEHNNAETGISLFSVNRYCEILLEQLHVIKRNKDDPAVKVETDYEEIDGVKCPVFIVKLPILKGEIKDEIHYSGG